MDADRLARYTDRWVDFVNGLLVAAMTALIAQTWVAGAVLLTVMVASALASTLGPPGRRPLGRRRLHARGRASASRSSPRSSRSARSSSPPPPRRCTRTCASVDGGRVDAAVREHRVQALLDGVPVVMVQCGVVAAWGGLLTGHWGLATALLVANAVSGFDWFGRVAGVGRHRGPRHARLDERHQRARRRRRPDGPAARGRPGPRHRPRPGHARSATRCARSASTTSRPCTTTAPSASRTSTWTSTPASWCCCSARSGSGKSSLLGALAGLVASTGEIRWNDQVVDDPQTTLRPARVAHVAQVPRVLSGTLHRQRRPRPPAPRRSCRRWSPPGWAATSPRRAGPTRSSGTAAYASPAGRCSASRSRGRWPPRPTCCWPTTCPPRSTPPPRSSCGRRCARAAPRSIGATSKAAALAQADRVVVLDAGRVVDDGPWRELSARWAPPRRLTRPRRASPLCPRGWVGACASSSPEHRVSSAPTCPTHLRVHGHEVTALVRREPTSAHESRWDPQRRRRSTARSSPAPTPWSTSPARSIAGNPHSRKWSAEVLDAASRRPASSPRPSPRPSGRPRSSPATASPGTATTASAPVTEDSESRRRRLPHPRRPRVGGGGRRRRAQAGARVCVLRTAPVMDRTSPPLKQLRLLFQLGGGARLGSGEQYMPMISLRDWIGAVSYLVESRDVSGAFNLCCPQAPTNAEFTQALATRGAPQGLPRRAGRRPEGRRPATSLPSCWARSTPAPPRWSAPATTSRTRTCARCWPPRSPDRAPRDHHATARPPGRTSTIRRVDARSAGSATGAAPPTARPPTTRSVTTQHQPSRRALDHVQRQHLGRQPLDA